MSLESVENSGPLKNQEKLKLAKSFFAEIKLESLAIENVLTNPPREIFAHFHTLDENAKQLINRWYINKYNDQGRTGFKALEDNLFEISAKMGDSSVLDTKVTDWMIDEHTGGLFYNFLNDLLRALD